MYCTLAEARAAGAAGSDDDVAAAIASARVLVDRYTRQWWEPTPATVSTRVGATGFAPLPYPVQDVTEVREEGATLPLLAEGYVVSSSTTLGAPDGVRLRGHGSNILVAGAEPWRGGYANLTGRLLGRRVLVTGTLGHAEPDPVVRRAAARLAAWLTNDGGMPAGPGVDVDTEGNAVVIRSDAPPPALRSTGLPEVDAALASLLVERVLIG